MQQCTTTLHSDTRLRPCYRCCTVDTPIIGPGAGPHWRSALQLAYLTALGDTAPQPVTMLIASQRIDTLTRKGQP
jgi:hypothetical protein